MDVDPILSPLVAAVTDGERKKRDAQQAKRQFNMEQSAAAAEERDLVSHTERDTSRGAEEEEEEEVAQSAAGSAYNPENPYHVSSNTSTLFMINSRVVEFMIKKHVLLSPEATLKVTLLVEASLFWQCVYS